MPDLLKNIYNHESLRKLALDIQSVYNPFLVDEFLKSTMDETMKMSLSEDLPVKAAVLSYRGDRHYPNIKKTQRLFFLYWNN